MNEPTHCKWCNALVIWAVTTNGKRIALDAEPGWAGTFVLEEGAKGQTYAVRVKKGQGRRSDKYRVHFSSCSAMPSQKARTRLVGG